MQSDPTQLAVPSSEFKIAKIAFTTELRQLIIKKKIIYLKINGFIYAIVPKKKLFIDIHNDINRGMNSFRFT